MIELLRKETASLHEALEEKLYARRIMNKTLTRDELIHLLHINYLYFQGIENLVREVPSLGSFQIQRAHLALQDLQSLGVTDVKPTPAFPWASPSADTMTGILYVTLGSALGGRVISKKLEAMPHFNRADYSFYHTEGDQMVLWKKFMAYLSESSSQLNTDETLTGAKESFHLFSTLYEHTRAS